MINFGSFGVVIFIIIVYRVNKMESRQEIGWFKLLYGFIVYMNYYFL